MKTLPTLITACALALFAANAPAAPQKGADATATAAPADTSAKPTQQNRMKTCNAEAKGKKGDERKAFMKECLSR
jgi:hypothetical protein